jgi:hypothetical protein
MFSKSVTSLLLASLVTANSGHNVKPVEVDEPFLNIINDADLGYYEEVQDVQFEPPTKEGDMPGASLPAGTYPCIFKVGDSFFDYTPFRLALQVANSGYAMAINQLNTTQFVFGICQQLSTISASPCQGSVFAEANEWDPATCVAYSGGSYTDISVAEIPAQDVNFADGSLAGQLSGVQMTYSQGAPCPYTSAPSKFHINIFCDANTPLDFNPIADTTNPCEPTVQLIS